MKKIKLRPHHIESILNNKILSAKEQERLIEDYTSVYGESFTKSYLEIMSKINEDTIFQVVLGNDFICNSFKCPYRTDCADKNYSKVANSIIKKLGSAPKEIIEDLRTSNPDMHDMLAIKKYDLVIGNTYRFRDMIARFWE